MENSENKKPLNFIEEIVEDHYCRSDNLDPTAAYIKKRKTLIFSKEELRSLVSMKIYKIIDDVHFLHKNIHSLQDQNRV